LDKQADIRTFINFGTLYPFVESTLALRYPALTVIGYDRAPLAKRLNTRAFKAKNLVFLDGPFAESVGPHLGDGAVWMGHARTTSLMFPDEVRNLYAACARLGVDGIVTAEQFNFSDTSRCFPDFARSNRPSAAIGGHMIAHDYPYYLGTAGYGLREARKVLEIEHWPTLAPKAYSCMISLVTAPRCAPP